MANKGNGGFIPIIFLIVGLAIAVLLSLFWVRSLQLACVRNGTCIILPFINNGGFYATSTEALIPEIPQPVIGSVPEVSVVDCRYYNIDSILFDWEMPEGVDGVEYGMSENLGPIALESAGGKVIFGGRGINEKEYSEKVSAMIDEEVSKIMKEARARAEKIIVEHKALLEAVAKRLIETETIEKDEFERILVAHGIQPKRKDDIIEK